MYRATMVAVAQLVCIFLVNLGPILTIDHVVCAIAHISRSLIRSKKSFWYFEVHLTILFYEISVYINYTRFWKHNFWRLLNPSKNKYII